MEYTACDFCGSTEHTQYVSQTDLIHSTTDEMFFIVKCKSCGLHFLNPRPAREEIGNFYSKNYSFHSNKSWLKRLYYLVAPALANSPLHNVFNIFPPLSRMLIPYVKPRIIDPIREIFRGGSILDIGCGSGLSANFWGPRGSLLAYRKIADVYGVEVADEARSLLALQGIPVYKNISDIPTDLKFDFIRMNWSLEHVHSPSEYFKFIADRLSAQGVAIITVPNYGGLIYLLAPDCVEVPLHLFHFKKQDIYNYAQKHELDVIKFQTFSYPGMYVYAATIFPQIAKSFTSPMRISEAWFFQKFLSRLDVAEIGNDMLCILRKKNHNAN